MVMQLTPRLDPKRTSDDEFRCLKKRAPWRQKLVDAERGFTLGVRGDSSFCVHFFVCSAVIAAAVVFGLSLLEWTVLVLALTMVLSAQMFNQVLKTLLQTHADWLSQPVQQTLRIGTAAVFVSIAGAVVAIGLMFGRCLLQIFAG